MPGLTLAEARAQVADYLDDAGNVRWTTAKIDIALQGAISSCVSDYVAAGGKALNEEISANTSAAGLATLSVAVLEVVSVQVVTSGQYFTVQPITRRERGTLDNVARTLAVELVRDFVLPSTTSHPLIGVGATGAATWDGFDQWVCATAALRLGITDNDKRPGLQAAELATRDSALSRTNTPRAKPLPFSRADDVPYLTTGLRWLWTQSPTAPTIQLTTTGWGT